MPEQENPGGVSYSLTPYSGAWTKAEAAHLLRRTMFGPKNQQILDAVTNGMTATVTSLLQMPGFPDPLTSHPDETIAAQGTTWINSVYPSDPIQAATVLNARNWSLGATIMDRLNTEGISIAEKLCLFWQNHWAATAGNDARATYDYHNLIYTYALGNFKQFVKDMTINPNMLIFLNGGSNNVFSPNENYARELLELFTIGKGPQIGPGDYTNYTEDDVAAAAKILTGYYVEGLLSDTLTSVNAVYNSILHDNSTKTLSAHFGNATIVNNGANEYADLIDVIFQQDEVAFHICRKLYRYFVNYDLTTVVETNVIPEMANTLITNNYEILPVLTELFSSEHFYDISVRGAVIRGPLDSIFAMFNSTHTLPSSTLATKHEMLLNLYWLAETQGQAYANPPSVAGWPAYHQTPSYSKLWVNAAYLKLRFDVAIFITILTGVQVNGEFFKLDCLSFVDNLSLPADAPTVIQDIVDVFFPKGVSALNFTILKSILTNGQPDFEWTLQYNDYQADPLNTVVSDPVRQRVEQVLMRVFQMPEFHVM